MTDLELLRNGSGYIDPTAYKAIKNAEADQIVSDADREKYRKLIGCILRVCELSGFEVESRIVLRDKNTGKIWL